MKILVNADDAICNVCGHRGAEVVFDHQVVCEFCESTELKDKNWNQFIPIWKTDSRNPARKLWSHHMRRKGDIIYGRD